MNLPVQELRLGSAKGGKGKQELPVSCFVVRALTAADIPAIEAADAPAAPQHRVKELRTAHHQLAQMFARGEEAQVISLTTGYSTTYLSILKSDPAFAELIKHYMMLREEIFVDLVEREKALGTLALEELQSRLAQEPEKWTKKEIMELYDRVRPAGAKGTGGGGPAAPPVAIQVNFVSKRREPGPGFQTIEATVKESLSDL